MTGSATKVAKVPITTSTPDGDWVEDRVGDSKIGPAMSFDGDDTTCWNPQAKTGYAGNPGIIYTLDGYYNLDQVTCTFSAGHMYFDLYASQDGEVYTKIAGVTEETENTAYIDKTCTLNANVANKVKYLKVVFTGRNVNNFYVNFYEIEITCEVPVPMTVGITNNEPVGEWTVSRVGEAVRGPEKSYDGIADEERSQWNPQATNVFDGTQGIVYTLDDSYILKQVKCTFGLGTITVTNAEGTEEIQHLADVCFEVWGSPDGVSYTLIDEVTAETAESLYTEVTDTTATCTFNVVSEDEVRYVKVLFKDRISTEKKWISFYEIDIIGTRVQ